MTAFVLFFLKLAVICGQAIGAHERERTERREQLIWDACLFPGKEFQS